MARTLRIEYEGAYYHLLSRGNNQQAIFLDNQDRYTFLKTLGRMAERFEVDIFVFVLMDNHYHLMLRTNSPNLSKAMQWLGTTYTTIFNQKNSRKGHLFQGRYKSILIENESYLLRLSFYIHRNPLRAGMVDRLVDYPWSSYPAYAYNRMCPDWLETDMILSQFGHGNSGRKAYREKVQQYSDEEKNFWEEIKHGMIYGSESFANKIKKKLKYEIKRPNESIREIVIENLDIDTIIETVSVTWNIDIQRWKNARRIQKSDIAHRDMLVYFLWRFGRFSNSTIGNRLGLSESSISRRVGIFQNRLEQDKRLQVDYKQFKSIIKV